MNLVKSAESLILVCLLSGSISYTSTVFALDSDKDQPITIDSNSATYDEKDGVSIYEGNVIGNQGSMHLEADKLVVYTAAGAISKLVATGNPVKFKQLPGVGKEEIKGRSLIAEYYPEPGLLVMMKEAVITQGTSQSASELIRYDSRNGVLKAGETESESKRVRATFQPKPKNNP